MEIDFSKFSLYQLLDYMYETERVGVSEMTKIIKERTEDFDPELLRLLSIDVQCYLSEKIHELEEEFTEEEITNAIEERKRQGKDTPYREYPIIWEIMSIEEKKEYKEQHKGYCYEKKIDIEALLFPYQFSTINCFVNRIKWELKQRHGVRYTEDEEHFEYPPIQELPLENPKQSKTILINGRTPNLLERYLIADKTLNLEKALYALNVSEKERYKLLALVLGCNETNARLIMTGQYKTKTNEEEIKDFVNKYPFK